MTPNVLKLSGDGGAADGVRCSAMLGRLRSLMIMASIERGAQKTWSSR